MANAARHEPEAVAALRAGRDDRMNRILRLPLPAAYTPSRVEALRDRLRSRAKPAKPQRPAARKASGRSAPPPAKRRSSRSASNGQVAGRHHGGAQRHADQQGRAKGRVLEGQRYG